MVKTTATAMAVINRVNAKGHNVGIDPAVIIAVIGLIRDLVQWYISCHQNHPTMFHAIYASGSLLKARAERLARKNLQAHNLDVALANSFGDASVDQIHSMSEADLKVIVDETVTAKLIK